GAITALGFVDGNGGALKVYDGTAPFTDGTLAPFEAVDGGEIRLFSDPVLGNRMVLGVDTGGDIVFALFLDPTVDLTSAKVWMVQFEPISNPDATNPDDPVNLFDSLGVAASSEQSFNFAGAPSGANLFMIFGDPNSTQIVVIGESPLNQSEGGTIGTKDVLNISQAGSTTSFGVNGNQLNDSAQHPTEGAFITYVTGTNPNFLVPNLDQNEADVEANIQFQNLVDANTASFTVNQTNPGVGPVTVKITAFTTAQETGVNFVDGLTNDTHVNITSGSVVDNVVQKGQTQFTPVATVDVNGNVIVSGLSTGDKVSWTTSGTHNRALIENISAHDNIAGNDNNTFDIGGFSLAQVQPAPDEKLDFTVKITDADADTALASFS